MRIHILGICGTFMGGVALIAKQLGFTVTGSDENIYPPMSTALQAAGIAILPGYDPAHLQPQPDYVIVGNTISRGNSMIEYVLNKNIPYISGPQWLFENVLQKRHVLAVAGTHGKTTTTSVLTWILTHAQLEPGYLIGGVPNGLTHCATLGKSPYFVIEADEYDTAFYDKRSKFLHYHPRTLIINNLEYDHADIFPDLEALRQQFKILVRTVPGSGVIIYHSAEREVQRVMNAGCWSVRQLIGEQGVWRAEQIQQAGQRFTLYHHDVRIGEVNWQMLGRHNVNNALAAVAAAHEVGVPAPQIIQALKTFPGVKRRLEVRGVVNDITVYDDFAHHPTAIAATLQALRARVGKQRIIAVLEFGSYTMKRGVHERAIVDALTDADQIVMLRPVGEWDANYVSQAMRVPSRIFNSVSDIVHKLAVELKAGDHVLIMSNKGFGDIHNYLLSQLRRNQQPTTVRG